MSYSYRTNSLLALCMALALLAACRTPTPTVVKASSTSTSIPTSSQILKTPTRTPIDTSGPGAALQPSPTPTQTPYPTFAPATPPASAAGLQLAGWQPNHAEQMVAIAEALMSIELEQVSGIGGMDEWGELYDAASFLASVYQEALLRSPDSPQAAEWRIRLAHAQVFSDSDRAGDTLTTVLLERLSAGEVTFQTLEPWLSERSTALLPGLPYWSLVPRVTRLQVSAPGAEAYLVQASGGDLGAICTVLIQDENGYLGYPLTSSFYFGTIGMRLWVDCYPGDLTGDGVDEIFLNYRTGGRLMAASFEVLSLETLPPRSLRLHPMIEQTNRQTWPSLYYLGSLVESPPGIDFNLWPSRWDCGIYQPLRFEWNGAWFAPSSTGELSGEDYALPECAEGFLAFLEYVPQELRVPFLERFSNEQPDNDRIRYHLGLQHALQGNSEAARQTLQALVNAPSAAGEPWSEQARSFLKSYPTAEGVYQACAQAKECPLRDALIAMVRRMPSEAQAKAIERLRAAQAPILQAGSLPEAGAEWFTIHFPGRDRPELWIISTQGSHLEATFVQTITSANPSFMWEETLEPPFRLYTIEGEGRFLFSPPRTGSSAYINDVVSPPGREPAPSSALAGVKAGLLSGEDPHQALKDIQDLSKTIPFMAADWYLLGLAAEMAGEAEQAVKAYWRVWNEYPATPYAVLARYKLASP